MTEAMVGDVLAPLTVECVDSEKMKTMAALLRDPNPIHFDVDVVKALGLGERPVNQGPIQFAYLMNMLVHWAGGPDRLRDIRVRFLASVFAGDTVRAGGTVESLSEEGGVTLARCAVWVDIVGGNRAIEGTALVAIGE